MGIPLPAGPRLGIDINEDEAKHIEHTLTIGLVLKIGFQLKEFAEQAANDEVRKRHPALHDTRMITLFGRFRQPRHGHNAQNGTNLRPISSNDKC